MSNNDPTTPAAKPRGFAAMNPDVQRRIASAGGKTAHANGTAHRFTTEEARAAGAKGGLMRAQRRQQNASLMQANALEAAGQQRLPETDVDPVSLRGEGLGAPQEVAAA